MDQLKAYGKEGVTLRLALRAKGGPRGESARCRWEWILAFTPPSHTTVTNPDFAPVLHAICSYSYSARPYQAVSSRISTYFIPQPLPCTARSASLRIFLPV